MNFVEDIFEIRTKANPLFFDNRGLFIKILSAEFQLDKWNIGHNGFTLFDTKESIKLFMEFNRFGLSAKADCINFPEKISSLIRLLFSIDVIDSGIIINRIGVRTRNSFSFSNSFQNLKDLFLTKYINVPESVFEKLNLSLKDVAFPLTFVDGDTTINTNCGPVGKEQLIQFFPKYRDIKDDSYPEVSLFIDVDYYTNPIKMVDIDELVDTTSNFYTSCKEKTDIIYQIIMDDDNG